MLIHSYKTEKIVASTNAEIRNCAFISVTYLSESSMGMCVEITSGASVLMTDTIAIHIYSQRADNQGRTFFFDHAKITASRICVNDAHSAIGCAIYVCHNGSSASIDVMSVLLCDASDLYISQNIASFIDDIPLSLTHFNSTANSVDSKAAGLRLTVSPHSDVSWCTFAGNEQDTAVISCVSGDNSFRHLQMVDNTARVDSTLISGTRSTVSESIFVGNHKPQSYSKFVFKDCTFTNCFFSDLAESVSGVNIASNKFDTITYFATIEKMERFQCIGFSNLFTKSKIHLNIARILRMQSVFAMI